MTWLISNLIKIVEISHSDKHTNNNLVNIQSQKNYPQYLIVMEWDLSNLFVTYFFFLIQF